MEVIFEREQLEGPQKKMDWRSVAHAGREVTYRYTNARRFGAGVLLHDMQPGFTDGRVMLLRNSYGPEVWQIPGGGIDLAHSIRERGLPFSGVPGQPKIVSSFETAARRELREEVGLDADNVSKHFGYLDKSFETRGDGRDLFLVYEAMVNNIEQVASMVRPSGEISTVALMRPQEALELTLHHPVRAGIMALVARN